MLRQFNEILGEQLTFLNVMTVRLETEIITLAQIDMPAVIKWLKDSSQQIHDVQGVDSQTLQTWSLKLNYVARLVTSVMRQASNSTQFHYVHQVIGYVQQVIENLWHVFKTNPFLQSQKGGRSLIAISLLSIYDALVQIKRLLAQLVNSITLTTQLKTSLEAAKIKDLQNVNQLEIRIQNIQDQHELLLQHRKNQMDELKHIIHTQTNSKNFVQAEMQQLLVQIKKKGQRIEQLNKANSILKQEAITKKQQDQTYTKFLDRQVSSFSLLNTQLTAEMDKLKKQRDIANTRSEEISMLEKQHATSIPYLNQTIDKQKKQIKQNIARISQLQTIEKKSSKDKTKMSTQLQDLANQKNKLIEQTKQLLIENNQIKQTMESNSQLYLKQILAQKQKAKIFQNQSNQQTNAVRNLNKTKLASLEAEKKKFQKQFNKVQQQNKQQLQLQNVKMLNFQKQAQKNQAKSARKIQEQSQSLQLFQKEAKNYRAQMIIKLKTAEEQNKHLVNLLKAKQEKQQVFQQQIQGLKKKLSTNENSYNLLTKKREETQQKLQLMANWNEVIAQQNRQLIDQITSSNIELGKVRQQLTNFNQVTKQMTKVIIQKEKLVENALATNVNLEIVYLSRQRQFLIEKFRNVKETQINSILRRCLDEQMKLIQSKTRENQVHSKRQLALLKSKFAQNNQKVDAQIQKNIKKTLGGAKFATGKIQSIQKQLFELKNRDDNLKNAVAEIQEKMKLQALMAIPSQKMRIQTQNYINALFP